ncbi:MAG: hypothetical protein QW279_02655 [Candidatus Jordarchaeaceae archaeon]
MVTSKYYALPSPQPFLNITLTDTPLTTLSSSFIIDAISVYMAIMFIAVSASIILYSVFYFGSKERPIERYFAIMLMLTAALIGAVFSGDLLPLFIFWEAAAAGSGFLMFYRKTLESESHVKMSGNDNYCLHIHLL